MAANGNIDAKLIALKSDNPKDRLLAAYQLGQMGVPAAVAPLLKALKDSSEHVATTAADALGELRAVGAVPGLISALKSDSQSMRGAAAMALGKIADAQAVEPLIKALRDSGTYVRRNAADALGDLGDGRAAEPLRPLLQDAEEDVRVAAHEALQKLVPLSGPSARDGEQPGERIQFACSNCGKKCRTSINNVGKKGRCPSCGQVFAVPATSPSPAPEPAAKVAGASKPAVVDASNESEATKQDPTFGTIRFKGPKSWEGEATFRGKKIRIRIWADAQGPTQADRDWFQQIEGNYSTIEGKLTPFYKHASGMEASEIEIRGPNKYGLYEWAMQLEGPLTYIYSTFIRFNLDAAAEHKK